MSVVIYHNPRCSKSRAALALLEERGVTEGVLSVARALLDGLEVNPEVPEESPVTQEALDRAERELWEWYLEWSQIARVAISDGRLLRRLGFRQTRRNAATDDPTGVDQAELVDAIEDILDGPEAVNAADAAE